MSTDPMPVSIALIHDDDAVRARLGHLLETSAGVSIVASVRSAGWSAVVRQPSSVVLVQQQTAQDGRIELVEQLRASTTARIVMLMEAVDAATATASLRSGVVAMVRAEPCTLAASLRLVGHGICVFDGDALGLLVGAMSELPRNPLSIRERQVLSCLADGMSNAEAAAALFVSRETVKTHVAHLLRKLEVEDRLAAVDKASRIGLLA